MKVRREVKIMESVYAVARGPKSGLGTQIVVSLLSSALLFVTAARTLFADQETPAPQAAAHVQQTPDQLQQLVAPIALYPDSLVAQILAASTFPNKSSKRTDGCKRILT